MKVKIRRGIGNESTINFNIKLVKIHPLASIIDLATRIEHSLAGTACIVRLMRLIVVIYIYATRRCRTCLHLLAPIIDYVRPNKTAVVQEVGERQ